MARAPETIPPEVLLDDAAPRMREIAEALRALVRRARPDALERVRPRWGLLGYDVPVGRRARSFAWIWPQPEHVHLGFDWGIAMDDPYGLLHGRTKRVRWTTWDRLGQLDPATRAKAGVAGPGGRRGRDPGTGRAMAAATQSRGRAVGGPAVAQGAGRIRRAG